MSETEPNAKLNLQGVACPTNFVKAKLKLEELDRGQVLELVVDGGEAIQNVPASIKEEGHRILRVEPGEDNTFTLVIQKGE